MAETPLSPETLELVAARFRALSEPARLQLLQELRHGERTVGDLVASQHTTQANVSKHLLMLAQAGIVRRRRDGVHVRYSIADPDILSLCEIVCGGIRRHAEATAARVAGAGPA